MTCGHQLRKRFLHVAQEGEGGCGVACVASVSRHSYSDALAHFERRERHARRSKGFKREELIAALQSAGVPGYGVIRLRTPFSPARRRHLFPEGSIVLFRQLGGGSLHYMLKTRTGWMDPLRNTGSRRMPRNWKDGGLLIPVSYVTDVRRGE